MKQYSKEELEAIAKANHAEMVAGLAAIAAEKRALQLKIIAIEGKTSWKSHPSVKKHFSNCKILKKWKTLLVKKLVAATDEIEAKQW